MTKTFQWDAQLMRRAKSEFGCIECGVKEGIYQVKRLHPDTCSFGTKMSTEEKNKILAVWARNLQQILEKESNLPKPYQERCSVCKKNKATGTMWVSYHDDSVALFIVSDYVCCDDCCLITPPTRTKGRRWGFARGVVTKKKWELLNFLEDIGVVQ